MTGMNTRMLSIGGSIRGRAAVGLTAVALLASAASAVAGGPDVERPLKGSCETTFAPAGPPVGTPPVQTFDITLTCRLSHLGLTGGAAVQQVTFGIPPFAIATPQIVYVAANGDELYASFSGLGVPGPDGLTVAFAGTTTYAGGTGRFANATGWSLDTGSASLATSTGALTVRGALRY
jgi:hypothetical protein